MKIILLSLVLFISSSITKAQVVFCPPGAEWSYLYTGAFPGIYKLKIKYVRDSTLNSQTVKVLYNESFYKKGNLSCGNNTLIKQNFDTIFFRNCYTQNTWQILYIFSAIQGQSWYTTVKDVNGKNGNPAYIHLITVDSVTTININGFNLRRLKVKYSYGTSTSFLSLPEDAEIIERIGCIPYLFNYYNDPTWTDYNELNRIFCYSDNSIGEKRYTEKPCDFIFTGVNEIKTKNFEIKIFPNPVYNILNLECDMLNDNYTFKLVDIIGREVLNEELHSQKSSINIHKLKSGIYFIQLFDKGKLVATEKIIKE